MRTYCYINFLVRHVNRYYWTRQLVQLNARSRHRLLAVACVLYLPTRSIVAENIGDNLIFKCKTRKMGFLYAPKHKHMTVVAVTMEHGHTKVEQVTRLLRRAIFKSKKILWLVPKELSVVKWNKPALVPN